ncbi:MAG: excinuclease ABC subunit UvrC [Prevotellaceae bacterium]|nr:excinuclease ABC subunit UvrC [Prevotellaceae bacterium]
MTREEKEQLKLRLRTLVQSLPEQPGSYQYWDASAKIIYVGKAKNLKRRVSSYFQKEHEQLRTRVLVDKIADITYTVTRTEEDALLLENSLIKKYQPRYNVLLKDGKTYPSICVTNELLPRIFKTRNVSRSLGTYFGPYSYQPAMQAVLDIIRELFKPRSCRFPMTREGIMQGKYKACLDYHLHKCDAPCIGKQSVEDYRHSIVQAIEILKGNTRELERSLYERMQQKASELAFEEAEQIKQKYLLIDAYRAKSEVVSHTIHNVDVFSIVNADDGKTAFVNYLHVTNGAINQAFTFEYNRKLSESNEELLSMAIPEIRQRFHSHAREIIVPFEMEWSLADATFVIPKKGDKKHLLELSEMNGRQYRIDRLKQSEKLNPEQKQTRLMKTLQAALQLPTLPFHIECFDNSNISGTDAVAGCVVFKGLKPSKKDYRKYIIKTVAGPDDYASMREVVRRRYERMHAEGEKLPDLIVTDGGKGQMEAVRSVVEDELHLSIPIAGLAKDNRHRTNELLFGFPPVVVGMKAGSELFNILARMQDEVHRYAITFHRDKRSKSALHSELDDIKGVGEKTKTALFRHFRTLRSIRVAGLSELSAVIGNAKASLVHTHFHPQSPSATVPDEEA